MLAASKKTLRIVAAIVWLSGGVILLLKSAGLLALATELRPGAIWPWLAVALRGSNRVFSQHP